MENLQLQSQFYLYELLKAEWTTRSLSYIETISVYLRNHKKD